MSLTSILNAASAAISNSDYQIALSNANVANASDTGYTRKTASFSAITPMQALSDATVQRVSDAYLTKAIIQAASASGYDSAVSTALQNYDTALGSVGGGEDVSSLLTAFQTSLTTLASSDNSTSAKSAVVSSASALASGIRNLSSSIQALRTQANSDIADTVTGINTTLDQIVSLNRQIAGGAASGADVTDLEDQRDAALQTLAGSIGVSYYTTPDNQVQVYSDGGALLVGDTANHLSYTASSDLAPSTAYPGQISGVMVGGQDITTSIASGSLGGLISLRDSILPQEQDKLDALAGQLITQANAATNAGTASPPPSSLSSSMAVAASDSFSATGTLRVAVTDSSGAVVSTRDLDLSSYATVGDLVGALNGISGLSASISSSGTLTLSAAGSGDGVALADIGASVGASGQGVSAYFGFNNLFEGEDAGGISVNGALAASASGLPTATLSAQGGLAAGDMAVTTGDMSAISALSSALTAKVAFPTAGDVSAQNMTLQDYASDFVASAAQSISTASDKADSSQSALTAAQTSLENLTSVNTDQELTMLTAYEQQYSANAQMISMVRSLFDTLTTMMG